MSDTGRTDAGSGGRPDRRRNLDLRELLDELIELARGLSRRAPDMSAEDLEAAQERMEWLADEIWQAAVYRSSTRGPDDTDRST